MRMIITVCCCHYVYRKTKRQQRRRWWLHSILKERKQFGELGRLVKELELDGERSQQYFRTTRKQFAHILSTVKLKS